MSQSNLPQLSPPEFTFFNELKYSIGKDPLVTVENIIKLPNGEYLILVIVKSRQKAMALATILELQKNLGNIIVNVAVIYHGQVIDPIEDTFTPREVVNLFETALDTNRYFQFAVAQLITPGMEGVFPVFSKKIIQFFNDDLSDLYNNFNGVAADVFRDVFRTEINEIVINPSTKQNES
ncbi:hypothetical protein NDK43_30315 [Neobacillus pocheonensis]|uniref:Uncharacterized protein n=1 Tax=Neobacillus pocheonensis TaxID=363869 RepID=A0ABT0WIF3_9BACI|nr:hypothetical protein [Neobacillus pocheonensis]